MRAVLLYPPPWKISEPGEPPDAQDGPPPEHQPGDLDSDFFQIPYGLLSLAAQATQAGHQAKVFNLSGFTWAKVCELVESLQAEVWGMSCWTANRRGVALMAELIRRQHPQAHIIVGGPHATPLAKEMLEHYPAIDTVAVGESEETFLELLSRLQAGADPRGLAGTWFRAGSSIERAPERPALTNLDVLARPQAHFATHIVMTSRGCPWACTFCGAETSWGRGFRAHSVPYVLDTLEAALARLPVKMIQIKDDTFTTNRRRVLELCRGIRARNLRFLWSCDTRVDVLSEELLYEMRLAGCQRMSLGVESGSAEVLSRIDKKITPEEIIESTELARKYGIEVRYYMMLGNRGETRETFHETLAFLERARPHQYLFSCLSIFPGTRDFEEAEAQGWLERDIFFTEKFQELKVPFDADEPLAEELSEWFLRNKGLQHLYRPSVADARAVLARLGEHHAAHMDLAGALYREGNLTEAKQQVERALALGYPTPGLAYNLLACIAFASGDLQGMQAHFLTAARTDPQHHVLIANVQAARRWFQERGFERELPLYLDPSHHFQLLERTLQPTLPGRLPEDFASFGPVSDPPPRGSLEDTLASPVMLEGHEKVGFTSRRLRMAP
jgi:anaerobic magnesium-protoporphyrin IX monomethyl ester cyclase